MRGRPGGSIACEPWQSTQVGPFSLAFGQSRVMNAVKQPGVLGEVALFARLVIGQRHRTPVLELPRRVRHRGNVGVTVGTSELAAVNRMGEALGIDVQRQRLAISQLGRSIRLAVTHQTIIV